MGRTMAEMVDSEFPHSRVTGLTRRPCLAWRLVTGYASATRGLAHNPTMGFTLVRRPAWSVAFREHG
jgi:hypothetical protein